MPVKKATLQYAILTVVFVWAMIAQLTASAFFVYEQATEGQRVPAPFTLHAYSRIVDEVRRSYKGSGIRPGDEILSLNGRPIDGMEQMERIRFDLHAGDVLRVTLKRWLPNGQTQILHVPVSLHEDKSDVFGWTVTVALTVVLPLSCLLLGFFVAFMRPLDPVAWITMAMLASFGQVPSSSYFWTIWSPWREMLLIYHGALGDVWPLWMVLFGLYFPFPFQFLQKRKWIGWALAVPFIALAALEMMGDVKEGHHIANLHWLAGFFQHDANLLEILFGVYVCGFFAALGIKRHQVGKGDARRRLRYMTIGCSLALIPLLIVIVTQKAGWPLPPWALSICLLMLLFFPATMAYVIVVQRAMDIRMVVRSGVQYALASTGIEITRIALISGLVAAAIYLIQHSARTWETVLILVAGGTLAILLRRGATRLQSWMDRRFFREAYNSEIILTELSNSVGGFRDTTKLLETVAHKISQSLHVPQVALLVERGERYEPAYALGLDGAVRGLALRRDALTLKMLRQSQSPARVYFDDPQSWVHGAPDYEQTLLQKLDAQLLLPLAMNSRMLGVISLGPKRSEQPYSGTDIRLLSAVASQTGLALENARLAESIKQEIAQRERINRELEIAREVQERLFPQRLPQMPGLEVAGYCRPALGVGGDYYDFLRLPDDCIGIAIGDVAGKGIGAALMMASLQASLRGQTIRPCSSLAEMIQLINKLVYEASSTNSYATFFYAQYETKSRILHYVNAGHNPPILYRKDATSRVLRLDKGGLVIGLLPEFMYEEDRVQLQSGDVLVAYTDGISEAMNHMEEEWEEQRLIESIGECCSLTAPEIIKHILDRVDAFTAGARQHDDMTLAVMRVH